MLLTRFIVMYYVRTGPGAKSLMLSLSVISNLVEETISLDKTNLKK